MIIITAPHSKCDPNIKERNCDSVSDYASRSLYRLLPDPKILIPATHHRNQLDLNRKEANNTPFWNILRSCITTSVPPIVIDVHSFPLGLEPYEIFIITYNSTSYVDNLYQNLLFNGITAGIFQGNELNEIVITALQHGCIAFLLEYNESLSAERIEQINGVIAQYLTGGRVFPLNLRIS